MRTCSNPRLSLPFDLRAPLLPLISRHPDLHKVIHNSVCKLIQAYPAPTPTPAPTPAPTPTAPAPTWTYYTTYRGIDVEYSEGYGVFRTGPVGSLAFIQEPTFELVKYWIDQELGPTTTTERVCTEGTTKCVEYNLYLCVNNAWQLKEANSSQCGYTAAPPAPAPAAPSIELISAEVSIGDYYPIYYTHVVVLVKVMREATQTPHILTWGVDSISFSETFSLVWLLNYPCFDAYGYCMANITSDMRELSFRASKAWVQVDGGDKLQALIAS